MGNIRLIAIVALSMIVMIVNNGFILAGLTAFDIHMLEELGVSVTALRARDSITLVTLGITVLAGGYILDRCPLRPVMVAGLLAMAAGFMAYSFVQNPLQIYVIHILLGVTQVACGTLCCVVLLSRWTDRFRGLAVGALVAGSSLGNAVVPKFNLWLLEQLAWRDALLTLSLVPLLLAPCVWLIVRERPRGRAIPVEPAVSHGRVSYKSLIETPNYLALAVVATLTVFCVVGLTTNLAIYVQAELNRPGELAGDLLFTLFIGAIAAQLLGGFLADRFGVRKVHIPALALMAIGAFGLAMAPGAGLALWIVAFGAGWGANSAMLQLIPTRFFPPHVVGQALGGIIFFETLGGAVGPIATGVIYDLTGSYGLAFNAIAVLALAALASVSVIRPPEPELAIK